SWTCPLSAFFAKVIYSLSTPSAGAARAACCPRRRRVASPNNNNIRHEEVTART
ncbi:hypothetical protein QR685DRAFT_434813, partial [Neurospora intermedia]